MQTVFFFSVRCFPYLSNECSRFFLLNIVSISGFCTSMLPIPDVNELRGPVCSCGAKLTQSLVRCYPGRHLALLIRWEDDEWEATSLNKTQANWKLLVVVNIWAYYEFCLNVMIFKDLTFLRFSSLIISMRMVSPIQDNQEEEKIICVRHLHRPILCFYVVLFCVFKFCTFLFCILHVFLQNRVAFSAI